MLKRFFTASLSLLLVVSYEDISAGLKIFVKKHQVSQDIPKNKFLFFLFIHFIQNIRPNNKKSIINIKQLNSE